MIHLGKAMCDYLNQGRKISDNHIDTLYRSLFSSRNYGDSLRDVLYLSLPIYRVGSFSERLDASNEKWKALLTTRIDCIEAISLLQVI